MYHTKSKAYENGSETYNKAVNPNSPIMIAEMQNNKPMGVTTYRTSDELPEELRKALPDMEELRKLLQ